MNASVLGTISARFRPATYLQSSDIVGAQNRQGPVVRVGTCSQGPDRRLGSDRPIVQCSQRARVPVDQAGEMVDREVEGHGHDREKSGGDVGLGPEVGCEGEAQIGRLGWPQAG